MKRSQFKTAVQFPRSYISADASEVDKAVAQLHLVPQYLARINTYKIFLDDYTDIRWPEEKNVNEPRVHRLNEVVETAIRVNAAQAYLESECRFIQGTQENNT